MILVVDMNQKENSLAFSEFVEPIVSLAGNCEVRHYLNLPQDFSKYEKVILCGAPLKDVAYLDHLEKFQWLKTFKGKVLGICAGAQVIALVFGSSVKKCTEIGMTEIETLKENSLFSSKFEAYELHNLSFEPSENFEVLAKSEKCAQAIKHKKKEIYGVLFHPEVRNKEVIRKFLEL